MNNPDKIIHCLKCKKITTHVHLDGLKVRKVRCLKCGNVKDLKNPYVEIATQGKPEDA